MRLRTGLLSRVDLVRVTMGLSHPQRGFNFFPRRGLAPHLPFFFNVLGARQVIYNRRTCSYPFSPTLHDVRSKGLNFFREYPLVTCGENAPELDTPDLPWSVPPLHPTHSPSC